MSALISRVAMLAFIALALTSVPAFGQAQLAPRDAIVRQVRLIGQAFFCYANDNVENGNAYPTGKSSTEVFQILIDNGYIDDPSIFYVKMPGKVAPTSKKLKPENVCFDVTIPVGSKSSDMIPLVYLTGFELSFTPGAKAVPLLEAAKEQTGIAIYYKGDKAIFIPAGLDGSVPGVVSPNVKDANTGHYQQLTPDGPLQVGV